jgi:uncharacterized membrane protein YgcG
MKEHKSFVEKLDQKAISEAIGRAEQACSGEVRVHIQPKSTGGEIDYVAKRTFERLGMTKTAMRNGVLLFIASEEHRFVILGDSGIDDKVGPGFWDAIAARLHDRFVAGEFTEGIVEAIDACGEQLKAHFPYQRGDVNELSNEISIHHGDEKN